MTEFLQNYGFFILVAVLMLVCHIGHGGHGRRRREEGEEGSGSAGGHHH